MVFLCNYSIYYNRKNNLLNSDIQFIHTGVYSYSIVRIYSTYSITNYYKCICCSLFKFYIYFYASKLDSRDVKKYC